MMAPPRAITEELTFGNVVLVKGVTCMVLMRAFATVNTPAGPVTFSSFTHYAVQALVHPALIGAVWNVFPERIEAKVS